MISQYFTYENNKTIRSILVFVVGFVISVLGGLIGLGGAEFRLPLLIKIFNFQPLSAVVINKFVSFWVVIFSFIFRIRFISVDIIVANINAIASIIPGCIIGAYYGANKALNLSEKVMNKVIVTLLILLSIIMMIGHDISKPSYIFIKNKKILFLVSVLVGIIIGTIASTLGVAGGEIIIPTIILLYDVDIKIAGSLSLAISLPTMIIGLYIYLRSSQIIVLKDNLSFVVIMIIASMLGSYIGVKLMLFIKTEHLNTILGFLLLFSAINVFKDNHS